MEAEWMESIDIAVQCDACGEAYGVPTSSVEASQALLAEGCPMSSPERCPAEFYGHLVDAEVLEELRRAWADLEASAARHGALGPVVRAPALRRPPTRTERRAKREERAALARWHDDGGR